MSFALTAVTGELTGQSIPVEGSLTVGRADDCDLVLTERRLSRRHARFYEEDGRWFVEDLGSPNGTVVNERRVRKCELHPGDTIVLCKSTFRVQGEGDDQTEPPDPGPRLVKRAGSAPDLESMLAEDFFSALGLTDDTLLDTSASSLARLVHQTRSFALLHEIAKAMQRRHDPQAMLTAVLDVLLKATGASRAYAVLVTDDGGFEVSVIRGQSVDDEGGPPIVSSTVTEHVLRDRASILTTDASTDDRFAQAESLFLNQTRALMAAPMLLQDRVLGALVMESSHLGRRFEEPDLDLLSVVASTVGVGLHNLRLAQKREETIHALEAAQAELLATQERLIQAEQMAALGRLSSGIAHEVKNHLSPFLLASMVAKKYADDAEIQDAAELMMEAQQHILDLVNEVRAFARGGQSEHNPEPTDLVEVVKGVLRFVKCDNTLARARIELEIEAEPIVQLDAPRFRQVLINLLRNAADAVPDEQRPHIRIRILEHGGAAWIDVIDNGRGIPAALADQVFTPFFSTKGDKGLGLGLDISRKIIRGHGGELGFSSEPGKGTTFRIRLPAS
ncbi:MAG: FHA domain-containing protein [Myxococcales bacterium]|nr:FHA domain-containing protein [Myxococcales bacterium]MCB9651654.1 FHA domain-containing protein [Deltaproteobacteria bacterium]